MCISVDLPEPDGPITAVSLPALDLERDAAQRARPRSSPATVAAGEVGGNHGGSEAVHRAPTGTSSSLASVRVVPAFGRGAGVALCAPRPRRHRFTTARTA